MTPQNSVRLLGPSIGAEPLKKALYNWCDAHCLAWIQHGYIKTADPEIASMVPEKDMADDLLEEGWLKDEGRAIKKGSCAHRCSAKEPGAAWVTRGPKVNLKDTTCRTWDIGTTFVAEDSRLDVFSESRLIQPFAQVSDPPAPNVQRTFLMQWGRDGHPTKEACVIANDECVVAVRLDRAGEVLLHRLLQAIERWEAYPTYDGHGFEIGDT